MMELLLRACIIGIGATALLDLWALTLNRLFGLPLPNWAMVGRWFCHLPQGRFVHADIGQARGFGHELAAGWLAHYGVGILFAAALLIIGGAAWVAAPTPALPIAVGLLTVGCGWFILQPGMGAGIAAARKPDRNRIRILNVVGHFVFGVGLYAMALLTA